VLQIQGRNKMQMINVLKRLAELDAQNPNVEKTMVKESTVAECGMMPMPGMGMMSGSDHPPVAASFSINATAATGDEVANMLTQIMTLAGVHKVDDEHMGSEPPPAVMTMEPAAGDAMRSVIDKLNPDAGGEEGDIEEPEETDEAEYDNSPADPTDTNEFDPNEFAKVQNTPGVGDRMDGNMPRGNPKKENPTMESIAEKLMSEYQQFINESSDDDMEEGIEDRLKDLDPKNPVNIPAYKRKAASGDSADAVRNTKEEKDEKDDWHPSKHVTDPQKKKELEPFNKLVDRGSIADRRDYLDKAGVPKSESANESMADLLKLSGLR
jgi:hypothetical protein